jgi:hypothetical protein
VAGPAALGPEAEGGPAGRERPGIGYWKLFAINGRWLIKVFPGDWERESENKGRISDNSYYYEKEGKRMVSREIHTACPWETMVEATVG